MGAFNSSTTSDPASTESTQPWDQYVTEQMQALRVIQPKLPDVILNNIIEFAAFLLPAHNDGRFTHLMGDLTLAVTADKASWEKRFTQAVLDLRPDMTIGLANSFYLDSSTKESPALTSDKFRVISGSWNAQGFIQFGMTNIRSNVDKASWKFTGRICNDPELSLYRIDTNILPAVESGNPSVDIKYIGFLDVQEAVDEKRLKFGVN